MRIPGPPIVVEEDDVIGVCSTSSGNIGRLNLVAEVKPNGENFVGTEGRFGEEELCTQGNVPIEFGNSELIDTDSEDTENTYYVLRLSADIIMDTGN